MDNSDGRVVDLMGCKVIIEKLVARSIIAVFIISILYGLSLYFLFNVGINKSLIVSVVFFTTIITLAIIIFLQDIKLCIYSIYRSYIYSLKRVDQYLPLIVIAPINYKETEFIIDRLLSKLTDEDRDFEIFLRELPERFRRYILSGCAEKNKRLALDYSQESEMSEALKDRYLKTLDKIRRLEKALA